MSPVILKKNDAYEFRGDGAGSRAMTAGTVVTDKYMTLGNSEKSTKYRGKTLVGLRFSNLDIPKNATITHARIDFIRSKDQLLLSLGLYRC